MYADWKVDSEIPFLRYGNHVVILLWFFWHLASEDFGGNPGNLFGCLASTFFGLRGYEPASTPRDLQYEPSMEVHRRANAAGGTLGVSRPFQGPKLHPLRKRWENNHSGENMGKQPFFNVDPPFHA